MIRLLVCMVFIFLAGGCFEENKIPQPPFALPLIRKNPIDIDLDFRIKEKHLYAFSLSFRYPKGNQVERTRIRRLAIGDDLIANAHAGGKPLVLQVLMQKKDDGRYTAIFERSIHTEDLDLSSWSDEKFNKELAAFQLDPGDYKLSAKIIALDDALKDVDVDFRFIQPYRGK
jgi:hypothetical protein